MLPAHVRIKSYTAKIALARLWREGREEGWPQKSAIRRKRGQCHRSVRAHKKMERGLCEKRMLGEPEKEQKQSVVGNPYMRYGNPYENHA